MFNGIIEKKSKILSINSGFFEVENTFDDLSIGQSIAHDGACMTLTEIKKGAYGFFVMEETIKKTNFSSKKVGDYFNVERCMHIGDRIDGSFVLGHIDTTGTIKNLVLCEDKSQIMHINFPNKFKNLLIEKGSIAVNGVSLTLVDVSNEIFSISLIPYTLENTNLGDLQIGNLVNLEFDMIGKYIVKMHS